MKSLIKLTVFTAILISTAMGSAKEPKLMLTHKLDERAFVFMLDSPAPDTTIKFTDTQGNAVYSEKMGVVTSYSKKFDLSTLPYGIYFFEVEDAYTEILYTVSVSPSKVSILKKEEKKKPVFRKIGNKLYLNLLNLDESNVEIKVLDSDNRVLFKEVIAGEQIVEKAINFENAFGDVYTVVVSKGNDTYYENVLVK